jgi:SSS family transporter
MTPYLIVFLIYSGVMVAIGLYANKFSKTFDDYLIGKSTGVGWFFMAITVLGTQLSGAAFMGTVGSVARNGLSHLVFNSQGFFMAFSLSWIVFAVRLRKLADRVELRTVPDLMEARYESKWTRLVYAVVIIIGYLPYIGAQYMGAALLMDAIFGVPYIVGLLISAIVVGLYMTLGGYLADVWTDTFQGIWMVLVWVIVTPLLLSRFGGLKSLLQKASTTVPGILSFAGASGFFTRKMAFSTFLFALMAGIAQPASFFRFYSMKKWDDARWGSFTCQAANLWIYFSIMVIGLSARIIVPNLAQLPGGANYAALYVARDALPPFVGGLLLVGLMAAMMSTVDGLLLVVSAAVSRDIYQKMINPHADDKILTKIAMATTAIVSAASVLVVLNPNAAWLQNILILTFLSWGFLGIAFFYPTVVGLYWPKMNSAGAIAGTIAGVVTYVVLWPGIFFKSYVWGVHPWLPAIISSTIAMLLGVYIGKPNSGRVMEVFFPAYAGTEKGDN